MTYSFEDVPKTDWSQEVWRAAKLGQQTQLDRHFVGSEEIMDSNPKTVRVYYFTPPVGTVTLAIAQASNPVKIPG